MTDVLGYAARKWPEWFPEQAGVELEPVALAGGPAHQPRATLFVLARGDRRPAVVMKIAFTPEEAAFLEQEYRALSEVRRALSGPILETIPEPLGFDGSGKMVLLAARAVEGRRLVVPNVTKRGSLASRRLTRGFFKESFDWSHRLALASTQGSSEGPESLEGLVECFVSAHRVAGAARDRLLSFGRAVGGSSLSWKAGWQHRDVSVGNALVHRGSLRMVDWEHAGPGCEPWFDIAYAPGATVMLARRQGGYGSVGQAASIALDRRRWMGAALASEMESAWRHPLPISWAVTLTAMSTALRRERDGRVGWSDWIDLVLWMFSGDEVRRTAGWVAPDW
jgi:Phosphotransferase enzyme family